MRESRTYGSVRGALSNERPYRDRDRAVPTIPISIRRDMVGSRSVSSGARSRDPLAHTVSKTA